MQLEGKRALITGAGSGIGTGARHRGSAPRHDGRSMRPPGRALYATLSEMAPSGRHLRLRGDITTPAVRRGIRDYLWRSWGGLDVLVNNAGLVPVGPLSCTTDDELERVMVTNVVRADRLEPRDAAFAAAGRHVAIVNVGSMLGDIAYPLFAAYSASKFAVRGLSSAMRRELKPYGIGVTYAAPRATKTDASHAMISLVEPLRMRLDDPTAVASQIWRAVI